MLVEIILLLILRFAFYAFGLMDILIYLVISGILLTIYTGLRLFAKDQEWAVIALLVFGAYSMYILGERMISGISMEVLYGPFWFNIVILSSVILILYALTHSAKISVISVDVIYLALAVVNAGLKQFRGRGIDAIDLYSISTAMEVAGSYKFRVTSEMIFGVLLNVWLVVFIVLLLGQTGKTENHFKSIYYWLKRAAFLGVGCAFFVIVFQTKQLEKRGYTPAYSSDRNGIAFNIVYQLKYLKLSEPENYSLETVENIILEEGKTSDDIDDFDLEQAPNVIVIMNESFSDLRVIGELNTDIEVTPFLDGLTENVIRGYAYSSVYAGNTAVSEYEFLTGDSNILFHTMPYSTIVKAGTEPLTLVSGFQELGYTCIAAHSYYNSAYRRMTVYDVFGFDDMYFVDDMKDLEYLRGFATDASQYRTIYTLFEEKDAGERLFVFNVTMQNHGDYLKDDSGFSEKITLVDYPGQYPQAEQYLSCIHESDQAIGELITYFSNVEEPVVVLMFGDHQPGVEEEFYELLYASSDAEEELNTLKYVVPYYIWANYEIDTTPDNDITSLNYLSSVLKSAASIPMTAYDKYLLSLTVDLPVVSASCVHDAEGNSLRTDVNGGGALTEYAYVMYNHMSDLENSFDDFFSYGGENEN